MIAATGLLDDSSYRIDSYRIGEPTEATGWVDDSSYRMGG